MLAACLSSIEGAAGRDCQVIVVDDSAEAEGAPIAAARGAMYVRKAAPYTRGPAASRNIGLTLARGSYVAFIDDDDTFVPRGLSALLEAAGSADIVFGDYNWISMDGDATHVSLAGVTFDSLLVANSVPVGAFLMRRSSIRYSFDEHLRSHEDWDFILCNGSANGMRYVPGPVVSVRGIGQDPTSVTEQAKRHFWLDFLCIYGRHPAPHLAGGRATAMAALGIGVPEEALRIEPLFGP